DGATEVLHQQFTYSTTWPANSNPNWTSKNTTVTNTDLITGQVTTTAYTYGYVVVGSCCQDGFDATLNQIPVENTVVYKDGTGNTKKTVNKTWLDRDAMIGEQTVLDNGQG